MDKIKAITSKYPITYSQITMKNGVPVGHKDIPATRFYYYVSCGFPYERKQITRKNHFLISRGAKKVTDLRVYVPSEEVVERKGD